MLLLTRGLGTDASRGGDDSAGKRAGGPPRDITGWVALAATPTFGIMALLTAVAGGGDMICSSVREGLPLNGMTVMYLLMGFFHLTPWLKLVTGGGTK